MMAGLLSRIEAFAKRRQRERLRQMADTLSELLGSASIDVEDTRILVRGRGILKRWLTDPGLRFVGRGLK